MEEPAEPSGGSDAGSPPAPAAPAPVNPRQANKVFVGGLSWETT